MGKKIAVTFLVLVFSTLTGWSVVLAVSSIPDSDGTIQGCFRNHKNDREAQGHLRVVSDSAKCRRNETPISWSTNSPEESIDLQGTWAISNETADSNYSGITGQITFLDGQMTIDSGRFAAAGLVAGSESSPCFVPTDPISFKFLGSDAVYVSWFGMRRGSVDTFPQDAMMTVVEANERRVTLIGQGGCGSGNVRISYLERIQ